MTSVNAPAPYPMLLDLAVRILRTVEVSCAEALRGIHPAPEVWSVVLEDYCIWVANLAAGWSNPVATDAAFVVQFEN